MKKLNEKEEEKVSGGVRHKTGDFQTIEDIENSPIFEQLKNKIIELRNSAGFTELSSASRVIWVKVRVEPIIKENGYTIEEKLLIVFIKKYWDLV